MIIKIHPIVLCLLFLLANCKNAGNQKYTVRSEFEQSWFNAVTTNSVECYLATGYMNFIIANDVVVTAKFWKEGLPPEYKERDEQAKQILAKAFAERKIVQIDCMPLHHDGAGLHCHSRNQPLSKK